MKQYTETDRVRFEALYRAHYATVLRFLQRRSGPATAEEVAAETFAAAWRSLDDVPARELAWLLGVARNQLANHRREESSQVDKGARAGALAPSAARDPADAFGERQLIIQAFEALTEPDREALALVAWDGLSQSDAARLVGVTRVAFAARVSRARRRLARVLGELEDPSITPQLHPEVQP